MSKFEWASNQHRDTIASHIGKRQSPFVVVDRLFSIESSSVDLTKQLHATNSFFVIYSGHYDMISYFAVAQNDSVGRVRYQLLEVLDKPINC